MSGERKYNFIDLFAGCGGLSEGFLATGKFNALAHVEWELPMVKTLRERLVDKWNHTEEEAKRCVIRFDIQKTEELINGTWSDESIKEYAEDNDSLVVEQGLKAIVGNQNVDLIIGGPPCQAYSIAGRAQSPTGMKDDYRNFLFESYAKVVEFFKPKVFVFENVPGLLTACPGAIPVRERIFEAFKAIGYEIRNPSELKKSVYCAENFNVPQKRNRIIIIGVRKDLKLNIEDFYSALDKEKNQDQITVKDAIGNLPELIPTGTVIKEGNSHISHRQYSGNPVTNHIPRYHGFRDQHLFKEWLSKKMNSFPSDEKKKFYTKITGHTSNHIKYRNLEWDKPSPTIVAHLYKDGYMFIHPDIKQLRTITVREAALLQSFPEDFKFTSSTSYNYKMIGNAVPVLFAKGVALAINNVLNENEIKFSNLNNKRKAGNINVLIACEESQRVCSEFRKLGFNAFSCDLLKCSGGHPEWHFNCDIFEVIKNKGGRLQNGEEIFIEGKWDLMVAHPPCTFLAVSGARWFYHPEDKDLPIEQRRPHPRFPTRRKDQEDGKKFFQELSEVDIPHIAIENPIGIMNTQWRKPDQLVQPYFFGDKASKNTCLWLKNLPLLKPTNIVDKGEWIVLSSGKRLPKWYSDALVNAKTSEERRSLRSKTFPGFAKAIAEQWGEFLLNKEN